jgi:hypothetical protein
LEARSAEGLNGLKSLIGLYEGAHGFGYKSAHVKKAQGQAQSRTLTRRFDFHVKREASWTAPVLWRFSTDQDCADKSEPNG